MTLCVPQAAVPATAAVADGVARRVLGLVGDRATDAVGLHLDWAGPLALSLPDERAVQAACGIMQVHGRADGRPLPLGVDYASTVAGVLGAQGVCAALIARARGTEVRAVRTSVGQGALLALAQYLAAATADGEGAERGEEDGERAAPGGVPFVSADGVRFEVETLDPDCWREFWQRLGASRALIGRGWRPFQQRFATATCPLPAALPATMRRLAYSAVRAAADASGVAVLPVRAAPLPPVTTRPWTLTPFPECDHYVSVPAGATAELPLAGLRVVESTRRVQGPMAGFVLRLLGAEVVHIEPPGGDPLRGIPPIAGGCSARYLALNAGKTVAEIDFTTAGGRRAVRELVAGADVFLHNWAPGKAARLGLDAADLHTARPGLVYAWASGWGDAMGPTPPVGTDYLVQAHSGLGAALRPAPEPAAPSLMTLTDVLGGLVCAQGVLAALLARIRTGRGRRVDSSLFSAASVVPRGCRRKEWGVLDRPLRTQDGYLAPGPRAREHPDLFARVLGPGASANPAALATRARSRPTADWLPLLAEADLEATPVCTDLAALARDERFAGALDVGAYAAPRAPWEFS